MGYAGVFVVALGFVHFVRMVKGEGRYGIGMGWIWGCLTGLSLSLVLSFAW